MKDGGQSFTVKDRDVKGPLHVSREMIHQTLRNFCSSPITKVSSSLCMLHNLEQLIKIFHITTMRLGAR